MGDRALLVFCTNFYENFPTWWLVLVGSKLQFWFSSSLPGTDGGRHGHGLLVGGREIQVGFRASVNDTFTACAWKYAVEQQPQSIIDVAFTPQLLHVLWLRAKCQGRHMPSRAVTNLQILRNKLFIKFRATSVPWDPEGQTELRYPREDGPRSSSLKPAYNSFTSFIHLVIIS